MKLTRRSLAFFFALMLLPAFGGEKQRIEPALEADPSVLKIVDGLGDQQSAWLPAKKTYGTFNADQKKWGHDKTGPRPRNYCLKWVWAADRKRALFCGGNAGVPHKLNDVWEYDLASNTWVLLWEPDPDTNRVRHMKKPGEAKAYLEKFVKVDEKSGEIMTKRGAPFDPVHTWWGLTYDPELHALLWVMGNHHLHNKYLELNPDQKKNYKLGGFHKMRLWAYYPHRHKWEFIQAPTELRKSPAAIMDYIPQMRGSFYYTQSHLQCGWFDSASKSWKNAKRIAKSRDAFNQQDQLPVREAVSAYDSKNGILVVHHGGNAHRGKTIPKRTYHFDVNSGKWKKVLQSTEGPIGFDAKGPITYDSVGEMCFINHEGLWAYSATDLKWIKITPNGPGAPNGMACYNPEHNVLMVDSGGPKIWIYRHKARGSTKSSAQANISKEMTQADPKP